MDVLNIAVRLAQYASILSPFGLAAFAAYVPRAAPGPCAGRLGGGGRIRNPFPLLAASGVKPAVLRT